MSIEIVSVNKAFGSFTALNDVNLTVPSGELTALLGPSGSGKTTLLRIIAGLETPDAGSIRFDGEETTDRHVRERQVGFVFQHYALFRHMTVAENVAFGLTVKPRKERPSKKEIRERVFELLRLVQLEGLADRYPSQLSGGQRQRVALARALAVEPKVLLLDEPFGALDAKVRVELRRWLRRLHDEIHVTSVFVTHDQEEALEVADRIVVMNKGRIEQVGTPAEVYDQPANPFVFDFLGSVNLFHCRAEQGQARAAAPELSVGYVRSHDIEVERTPTVAAVEAEVRHVQAVGPAVRVELLVRGTGKTVEAELSRDGAERLALGIGETVYARPRKMQRFVGDYQI
ncbi:sulfate ABC transporter, ATPase subunit [Geobacter metallireducens RCH3]|uniref:Sulfate ABC transporter, ATP-binding protein n=1 Tax=Geobacter metallireducens (strain ATCC 53774 / DSM 7210 / GS-15) TaxID=269799 RepID=Q39UE2_GEOMG|nr:MULTISPECIES: sulfate ABC transporter ATP-binding protein [Geobacter]ABB32132.1 sulfate ABC transporter, ATP-binding protein [Geobacter metallireducens GS-15]EHP88679.1 sulfate ABC transporter, ATPase subunit [Geobacter metallireducens RCH3]MBT1074549.1 sulfate ABC transporter ATP-binding protein [Geobacter grbiciae]